MFHPTRTAMMAIIMLDKNSKNDFRGLMVEMDPLSSLAAKRMPAPDTAGNMQTSNAEKKFNDSDTGPALFTKYSPENNFMQVTEYIATSETKNTTSDAIKSLLAIRLRLAISSSLHLFPCMPIASL
ncbi:hypothetical protein CO614_08655 [Lysobacteraceae bacterium NML120232]|nr:hypothetical protein CO614_08655 [Xanthomonadaceae bacterium NML120232]